MQNLKLKHSWEKLFKVELCDPTLSMKTGENKKKELLTVLEISHASQIDKNFGFA